MMVVPLTAEDVDFLERACAEDETPAAVEAICSCKFSTDVCRVVQGRLLLDAKKSPAAFGFGLARGIRRLRSGGGNNNNDDDDDDDVSAGGRWRHLLRASASSVSKALQSDVGETANAHLHRGLRQPALLLALLEVVRDNGMGSAVQRAAGSALVAFCDCKPGLWRELAKEVAGNSPLLEGFLEAASKLALISDHRAQEFVFEALYRLWKVWKKQTSGPPALQSSTPREVKDALESITIEDFEGQTRAMLASLNSSSSGRKRNGNARPGGDGDEEEEAEEEGCWVAPPSSFPVEAMLQATAWEGLGMTQRLGDGKWLDVNGDNIGIQVYPRASPGKSRGTASSSAAAAGAGGVFMSISAETVKRSSKVLVAKRSLQVEVSFSECPVLARLAHVPPGKALESGKCTLIVELGGGARVFSRFRKAIAALTAAVPVPRSNGVPATKPPKVKTARGSKTTAAAKEEVEAACEAEIVEHLDEERSTAKKRPWTACSLASSKNIPPTSSRKAAAALVTPLDGSAGAVAGAPRRSVRAVSSTRTTNKVTTDSGTDNVSPATAMKTGVRGGGFGGSSSAKTLSAGSFRRVAQGTSGRKNLRGAEGTSGGGGARHPDPSDCGEAKKAEEEEVEDVGDSWMTPRRCLDLAPVPVAAVKKHQQQPRKARPSKEKKAPVPPKEPPTKRVDAGRPAHRGEDDTEWDPSDSDDSDGARQARRPQEVATPPKSKSKNRSRVLTRASAEGRKASPHQDRRLDGGADSQPDGECAADGAEEGVSRRRPPCLARPREDEDARARAAAASPRTKPQARKAGAPSVDADTPRPPRGGKERGAAAVASNYVAEGIAENTDRASLDHVSDGILTDHSASGGVDSPEAVTSPPSRRWQGGSARRRGPPSRRRQQQQQQQQQQQRGGDDIVGEGRGRDGGEAGGGGRGFDDSSGAEGDELHEDEEDCVQSEEQERELGDGDDGEDWVDEDEEDIEWEEEEEGGEDGGGTDEDEDDEDHTLLKVTRMFQQVLADAKEKDRQIKKRKVDDALDDARGVGLGYIDQVSQQVTGHWKSVVDDLVERGRKAEEGVTTATEGVAALVAEQEAQWRAARDRVHKHESALKRLEALLGGANSSSELEGEWKEGGAALQLKLQKYREGAASRFSKSLASSGKKARRSPGGGSGGRGRDGGGGDLGSLLGQLGGR